MQNTFYNQQRNEMAEELKFKLGDQATPEQEKATREANGWKFPADWHVENKTFLLGKGKAEEEGGDSG